MNSGEIMNKKGTVLIWYILAVILLFGFVLWGLIGNHQVTNLENTECTLRYGVLCLRWESSNIVANDIDDGEFVVITES